MRLSLEFWQTGYQEVDAGIIHPDRLLPMHLSDLQRLEVTCDGESRALGEICRIHLQRSRPDEIHLSGNTSSLYRAGCGLQSGRIVVEGDAGNWSGSFMSGGELVVHGNAGDLLGAAMQGGVIRVHGCAGERAGAACLGDRRGMSGGAILISGSAGDEAGRKMRRGLLAIGGDAGDYAGADLVAGSIVVLGRLGDCAGIRMRRGSLVAGASPPLLPGFRPACRSDFLWIRLYLLELKRLGFPVPDHWWEGAFQRYTGHDTALAKGEILIYAG